MRTLFIALRAVTFMSGFVLLWGWVALGVRGLDSRLGASLPAGVETLGIVVATIGAALVLLCVGTFVLLGQGTPAPFDAPREFVAAGPYRRVRNPMYIGGWILLIGFGLYQRSISILLFSLAWFLLAHLFVVLVEEPGLRRKFGATYERYCQTVPRWLPRRTGG